MHMDPSSVSGWHISSYSPSGGASCIEIGWHKSSYSPNGGGSCVEVGRHAPDLTRVAVRDSTQRGLGFLSFDSAAWTAFVKDVQSEAPAS